MDTTSHENKIYKTNTILKETILEEDKIIKYLLNYCIFFGALGFLIVGISSYIGYNLIPFLKANEIIFFPQGLTMCFYGICGIIVGINQIRILTLKIGEGYNEFNKEKGIVKIYRKGLSSDINITYAITDIVRINKFKEKNKNLQRKLFLKQKFCKYKNFQ